MRRYIKPPHFIMEDFMRGYSFIDKDLDKDLTRDTKYLERSHPLVQITDSIRLTTIIVAVFYCITSYCIASFLIHLFCK